MKVKGAAGGLIHDESQWPLVIVRLPSEAVADSDLEDFAFKQRAMLARNQHYVEIADASHTGIFTPQQRRWMGEFLRETHGDSTRLCEGLVVVIRSKIIHGAMTAVLWIIKPDFPMKVVGSVEEAFGVAAEMAAEAELRMPMTARDHLLRGEVARFAG